MCILVFFFNPTATTYIYTLSLHDALPIYLLSIDRCGCVSFGRDSAWIWRRETVLPEPAREAAVKTVDRKSTRLNSSHVSISYAVFCLKKKRKIKFVSRPSIA